MDRSLWTATFSATACPPWPCPVCHKGTLVTLPKTLVFEETVPSARAHQNEDFEPDWVLYYFTAWAKRPNTGCEQKSSIAGTGGVSPEYTCFDHSDRERT